MKSEDIWMIALVVFSILFTASFGWGMWGEPQKPVVSRKTLRPEEPRFFRSEPVCYRGGDFRSCPRPRILLKTIWFLKFQGFKPILPSARE